MSYYNIWIPTKLTWYEGDTFIGYQSSRFPYYFTWSEANKIRNSSFSDMSGTEIREITPGYVNPPGDIQMTDPSILLDNQFCEGCKKLVHISNQIKRITHSFVLVV